MTRPPLIRIPETIMERLGNTIRTHPFTTAWIFLGGFILGLATCGLFDAT